MFVARLFKPGVPRVLWQPGAHSSSSASSALKRGPPPRRILPAAAAAAAAAAPAAAAAAAAAAHAPEHAHAPPLCACSGALPLCSHAAFFSPPCKPYLLNRRALRVPTSSSSSSSSSGRRSVGRTAEAWVLQFAVCLDRRRPLPFAPPVSLAAPAATLQQQQQQVRRISTKRRRYFKMRKFHKKKYKKRLLRSNKNPFFYLFGERQIAGRRRAAAYTSATHACSLKRIDIINAAAAQMSLQEHLLSLFCAFQQLQQTANVLFSCSIPYFFLLFNFLHCFLFQFPSFLPFYTLTTETPKNLLRKAAAQEDDWGSLSQEGPLTEGRQLAGEGSSISDAATAAAPTTTVGPPFEAPNGGLVAGSSPFKGQVEETSRLLQLRRQQALPLLLLLLAVLGLQQAVSFRGPSQETWAAPHERSAGDLGPAELRKAPSSEKGGEAAAAAAATEEGGEEENKLLVLRAAVKSDEEALQQELLQLQEAEGRVAALRAQAEEGRLKLAAPERGVWKETSFAAAGDGGRDRQELLVRGPPPSAAAGLLDPLPRVQQQLAAFRESLAIPGERRQRHTALSLEMRELVMLLTAEALDQGLQQTLEPPSAAAAAAAGRDLLLSRMMLLGSAVKVHRLFDSALKTMEEWEEELRLELLLREHPEQVIRQTEEELWQQQQQEQQQRAAAISSLNIDLKNCLHEKEQMCKSVAAAAEGTTNQQQLQQQLLEAELQLSAAGALEASLRGQIALLEQEGGSSELSFSNFRKERQRRLEAALSRAAERRKRLPDWEQQQQELEMTMTFVGATLSNLRSMQRQVEEACEPHAATDPEGDSPVPPP
ncbi:hypothetical protein Efla_005983 [Eimeria flavescens]